MKTRTIVVALTLALTGSAAAQDRRAMTFDDVIALKAVSDTQISPDGKWVAYVVTSADMKENANDADIWLASASGAAAPIRLTTSKKADTQPRWSPDSKRIAFVSAREDKPQIFVMSPFGGEPDKLTESKTPVQAFAWSPDGARIAYIAQREPTAEEEKKEKDKDDADVVDRNYKFTRMWTIDVESKTRTELVSADAVMSDPQWSADGRSIAYVAVPTNKADDTSLSDIWIVDVESAKSRKVTGDGAERAPRWSPDGRELAFLATAGEPVAIRQPALRILDLQSGRARDVAASFLYEPDPPRWTPDGRTLVFTAPVRTTTQVFTVPAAGGTPTAVSAVNGALGGATFSRDGSMAAFTFSDVQHPPDVHVASVHAPFAPQKLSNHNPQVASMQLGRGDVIKWRSKDGTEIEGILIYPADYQPGKRYPTIAMIHGGPSGVWTQAFPGNWANAGQVWAGNGWAVFYPNVRGSSGYGEKFLLANVRDWGGGDYQDIQTGLDALIDRGVADKDKLAQSGWSYGGYMTAWTLTQTNRFKAVMVGAGLTDMFSMYSTNDLQRVLDGYFGTQPWNNLEGYRQASAMTYIKNARTPTLIQHGAADTRVPIGQAQELYMGLKTNGVPVELVFYPREPHGLQEPRHRLDKMKREYDWMAKYVLGSPKPASSPQ